MIRRDNIPQRRGVREGIYNWLADWNGDGFVCLGRTCALRGLRKGSDVSVYGFPARKHCGAKEERLAAWVGKHHLCPSKRVNQFFARGRSNPSSIQI
jgi:hypothetical protein